MNYPATLKIETPDRVANWRPIVQWILAIPHYIVLCLLLLIGGIATILAWIAVVVTGKLPAGLAGVICMVSRYGTRVGAYAWFLTDRYPPFDFTTSPADPGGAPTTVSFSPALEGRNRLTVLLRMIIPLTVMWSITTNINIDMSFPAWMWIAAIILGLVAIPAYVFASVVWIIAAVCDFLGFFAVLFTGRWPAGLRRFVVGSFRVGVRYSAFAYLLNDEHPPFSID